MLGRFYTFRLRPILIKKKLGKENKKMRLFWKGSGCVSVRAPSGKQNHHELWGKGYTVGTGLLTIVGGVGDTQVWEGWQKTRGVTSRMRSQVHTTIKVWEGRQVEGSLGGCCFGFQGSKRWRTAVGQQGQPWG